MASTTLYGISNCDTVKKARVWLDAANINYNFHDFRKDGLTYQQVSDWIDELGWAAIVNRRSTTWRELDPAARDAMGDDTAIPAIVAAPTLIKRPVLDTGATRHIGFSAGTYSKIFSEL